MLQQEHQDESPKWIRFNDDAGEVVRLAESSTFCDQVVHRVDDLNRRWKQFEDVVQQRQKAIYVAKTLATELDGLHRDIRRDLKVGFAI